MERNRRSRGELKLQQIITDAEIKQWALLLSSNDNKNKLIQSIFEHWKSNSNLINGKEFISTVDSKAYEQLKRLRSHPRITIQSSENRHQIISSCKIC